MKKKILYYTIYINIMAIILIFSLYVTSNASTPKIISTIQNAFEDIESWIIKISTPAAAVAVGTGLLMKKFSFGDDEKMRTGKKLIRTSLVSYALILSIDLILSAIKSLVG